MDNEDIDSGEPATPDDIRRAIDALTVEELTRLRKAATLAMYGSEFTDPRELINEAIAGALSSSTGGKGRQWKHPTKFMAFMIMTIRGIASDSAESPAQKRTVRYQSMALESASAEDTLAEAGHFHQSVEDDLLESETTRLRQAKAQQDADAIEAYFDGDQAATSVVMGMKEGMSPREICNFAEIDKTRHDSTRTKIRRAMEKMFPGRRAK